MKNMEKFESIVNNLFESEKSLFDSSIVDSFSSIRYPEFLTKHSYDIYEDGDNLILEINVAGFKRKEINVDVDGKMLTINGEREAKKDVKKIHNYLSKKIALKYQLENEPADIEATMSDGILKIVVKPKKQSLKKIEIK